MMRATELAHALVQPALYDGAWVVDATVGNGHDTVWLAEAVGPEGRVFGFDIQAAALQRAGAAVHGMGRVCLVEAGHERMAELLPPEARGRIAAVMFNLGYLPGADKSLTTQTETTVLALSQAIEVVAVGGVVSVIVYPGHDGGAAEADAVRAWARGLPAAYAASVHARINARTVAPELILIERVR